MLGAALHRDAVQWAGWLYGLLLLTGLTVWGLGRPPAGVPTTRWWRGGGRWSPDQLWAGYARVVRPALLACAVGEVADIPISQ